MAVDFFKGCSINISANKFGLCDDPPPPHRMAYCNAKDPETWIAAVDNVNGVEITFTAIDHCTVIYRADDAAKMESLCDCMLTYDDRIVFVELKNRDYPGVIGEAKEQLANTIRLFSSFHNLLAYKKRRAFIANKRKPNFPYQRQEEMNDFKRHNNVILIPDVIIKVK